MSEWLTYSLSDFLLFSPRTYHRLFELYNRTVWPGQVLALALGLAIVVLLRRGGARPGRVIAAILAGGWLWTAWAFHLERYATINWIAPYFAAGFALEGLLLAWMGVVQSRLAPRHGWQWPDWAGLSLLLFALVVQPLIGPLLGRDWAQTEVFAIAPDPTAVATLAVLLLACERPLWPLQVVPLAWCAITGATLWAMRSPDAWIPPIAAALSLALAVRKTLSPLPASSRPSARP